MCSSDSSTLLRKKLKLISKLKLQLYPPFSPKLSFERPSFAYVNPKLDFEILFVYNPFNPRINTFRATGNIFCRLTASKHLKTLRKRENCS